MSKAAELAALIANVNKGSSLANKNFIINGNMSVAQRATSATASGDGTYNTVDRWKTWEATDGAFTSEQSTDAPEGFSNSFKLACTTADTSLASSTYAAFAQIIEAQNLQSLDYGSSDAKPITLSFWVKSNKTGTYCTNIEKTDSTLYRYVKEYTISSADTWEYKTVTILPDSNIQGGAGAIANDNGQGFRVFWSLGHGSTYSGATADSWQTGSLHTTNNQVNWMDSTSNTFYITGVQLEIGEKATEFEHEPIGTTLEKCQRYYTKFQATSAYSYYGSGVSSATTTARIFKSFPVEMNHIPVLEQSANNTWNIYPPGAGFTADATINNASVWGSAINCTTGASQTANGGCHVTANNTTNAYFAFESEL